MWLVAYLSARGVSYLNPSEAESYVGYNFVRNLVDLSRCSHAAFHVHTWQFIQILVSILCGAHLQRATWTSLYCAVHTVLVGSHVRSLLESACEWV
jgi:hypothetical protein